MFCLKRERPEMSVHDKKRLQKSNLSVCLRGRQLRNRQWEIFWEFKGNHSWKVCQLVEKIRASTKNLNSKRLRMPDKRRATKNRFHVKDNAKLTEYLYRRRSQLRNARPTFAFFVSGVSIRREIVFVTNPGGGVLNIKHQLDYEKQLAASLTACTPLEDEDRALAQLIQERIKHNQRIARLRKIWPGKMDLTERDLATPRNKNGFRKKKHSSG